MKLAKCGYNVINIKYYASFAMSDYVSHFSEIFRPHNYVSSKSFVYISSTWLQFVNGRSACVFRQHMTESFPVDENTEARYVDILVNLSQLPTEAHL